MARFDEFIGGSYAGRASASDAERSVNWFVERVESPGGQAVSPAILLAKPGLKMLVNLWPSAATPVSVQALLTLNGRTFAVSAGQFFEIAQAGTSQSYGPALGLGRAQMVASQSQILILDGASQGWLFNLGTLTFTLIANWPANIVKIAVSDGYFLALQGSTQNFFISGINDGLTWDSLDYGNAQGEPGNVVTFVVDHRQLWLLSNTHCEIYYDSGNSDFPFSRLEGAFAEQGCCAVDSVCKFDNSIIWLGANADGSGVVWRANGYTPQRVSTHAFESACQSYSSISDASAYVYQEGGHTFYRLDFPSANAGSGATWLYDAASGYWHERTYYNPASNQEQADLARCHSYNSAWGMHIVGDYQSGNLYIQSTQYATDAGAPIRRMRVGPPLTNGGQWRFFGELRLMIQAGVGLDGAVSPGADPQMILQASNDGGQTWGNERSASMGRIGNYNAYIVRWRQLGRSLNRVFRITCSEPVLCALIACEVD